DRDGGEDLGLDPASFPVEITDAVGDLTVGQLIEFDVPRTRDPVAIYASATSSSMPSDQWSTWPSGISSARLGSRSRTKSVSWLTRMIVPGQSASARAIASREPGSRLLVGSSSSNTLCRPPTSWLSASFVFSPPDRVPAAWKTLSPV